MSEGNRLPSSEMTAQFKPNCITFGKMPLIVPCLNLWLNEIMNRGLCQLIGLEADLNHESLLHFTI